MTKTKRQRIYDVTVPTPIGHYYDLSPKEITGWFAKWNGRFTPMYDSTPELYLDDNEVIFISNDNRERLVCNISYEERCPTCGGAYIKRWSLRVG